MALLISSQCQNTENSEESSDSDSRATHAHRAYLESQGTAELLPDNLVEVVKRWLMLSEAARTGFLAIVRATGEVSE